LDGRDIGTVICPDAAVKLFVTASAECRAQRRFDELKERGLDVVYKDVLDDVKTRDARDRDRVEAPLKPADDAILIDTTDLDIDAAVAAATAVIEAAQKG
jgi:cytidylate kinase